MLPQKVIAAMAPQKVAASETEIGKFFGGLSPSGESLADFPSDRHQTFTLPVGIVASDTIGVVEAYSSFDLGENRTMIENGYDSSLADLPIPWRLIQRTNEVQQVSGNGDMPLTNINRKLAEEHDHALTEIASTSDSVCDQAKSAETVSGDDDEEVCNVMIKNIPCRCSRQDILDAIDEIGFGSEYIFFHMPFPRGQAQNIGYAFVGFRDKDVTACFISAMTGYRFQNRNSDKSCVVVPARIQGMNKNLAYCQRRKCNRNRPTLHI
jgi:hypothetical protein